MRLVYLTREPGDHLEICKFIEQQSISQQSLFDACQEILGRYFFWRNEWQQIMIIRTF